MVVRRGSFSNDKTVMSNDKTVMKASLQEVNTKIKTRE